MLEACYSGGAIGVPGVRRIRNKEGVRKPWKLRKPWKPTKPSKPRKPGKENEAFQACEVDYWLLGGSGTP